VVLIRLALGERFMGPLAEAALQSTCKPDRGISVLVAEAIGRAERLLPATVALLSGIRQQFHLRRIGALSKICDPHAQQADGKIAPAPVLVEQLADGAQDDGIEVCWRIDGARACDGMKIRRAQLEGYVTRSESALAQASRDHLGKPREHRLDLFDVAAV